MVSDPAVRDRAGSLGDWSRSPLDQQVITAALQQHCPDWPTPILKSSVASTFFAAAELAAADAPEGSAVVAEEQTAGRGRQGRSWSSPEGAGLWLTVIIDVASPERTLLPLAAGLAVQQVVQGVLPDPLLAQVKWPNDVVVAAGKEPATPVLGKIAGILVEVRGERCLVGVGLNVSLTQEELPAGVEATSLRLTQARVTPREDLLVELLAALHERLGQVRHAPHLLLADYRAASATLGREVEVTLPGQRRILGRAVDIDDGGGLVVEDSDGNRQLVTAGDVIHATI